MEQQDDATSQQSQLLDISTEFIEPHEAIADRKRRAAQSHRDIKYACSECGRIVGRDNLKAKRVQWREMGSGAPVTSTRTVAWLCIIRADDGGPSCLEKDPDWNRPAWVAAPGLTGENAGMLRKGQ